MQYQYEFSSDLRESLGFHEADISYEHIEIGGQSRAHLGNNYIRSVHYHLASDHERGSSNDDDMEERQRQRAKRVAEQKRRTIISHLYDADIERRSTTITDLEQSAYGWAFNPLHTSLRPWLEHDGGIFWITGKAGSGKSTFMKFLARNPMMRAHLSVWADKRSLIVGQHYFWYASTGILQRSFEGLLRGLLHSALCELEALSKLEEVIKTLFPIRWTYEEDRLRSPWSEPELLAALRGLEKVQEACFVFFLDGLDECVPSRDHGSLIRDLKSLSKIGNMKLCVSSRPWQIFQIHFGDLFHRLELHTLTYSTMLAYISAELTQAAQDADWAVIFNMQHSLVVEIATKAEGVFLWTVLVLRSLREDIEAGREMTDLHKCIGEMPASLKDFFHSMIFERIDYRDRSAVARLLKCASVLAAEGIGSNSRHFMSFLNFVSLQDSQEIDRHDFAMLTKERSFSLEDLETLMKRTGQYLGRLSRDLLHIMGGSVQPDFRSRTAEEVWCLHWTRMAQTEVQFLHRTVLDYLLDSETQNLLDQHVPTHFRQSDFTARVLLARMKSYPEISHVPDNFDTYDLDTYLCDGVTAIVRCGSVDNVDLSCLRVCNPHLHIDLMLEYDDLASRWIHLASRQSMRSFSREDGMLCQLLVSFGLFKYTSESITQPKRSGARADLNSRLLMQEAIANLFLEPIAPSQSIILGRLLTRKDVKGQQFTYHDEAKLQPCPKWWSFLLRLWYIVKATGKLTTPTSSLTFESSRLDALANHIAFIARSLCQWGCDVFEDPQWWSTESRLPSKSLYDYFEPQEDETVVSGYQEQSGTLFAYLLEDRELEQSLRDILSSSNRYLVPLPEQQVISEDPIWFTAESPSHSILEL